MNPVEIISFFILMAFIPSRNGEKYGILGAKYSILGPFIIWPVTFALLIISFNSFSSTN